MSQDFKRKVQKIKNSTISNLKKDTANEFTHISDLQKKIKIGSIIQNYRIESKLGSGGMANVHKAIDMRNGNIVALKSMKHVDEKIAQNRFVREYKFLKAIKHENLIQAYDFFKEDEALYIVLEYINGISLKKVLEEKIYLSFFDKLAIANNIARGISILNMAGIIHRDIKPENIMINKEIGMVKILDLGLGKDVKSKRKHMQLTMDNEILGTAMYLSPEQTEGKITKTSDIFSLGIVLYQLFANLKNSPFKGYSDYNCYLMIHDLHPPSIYKLTKNNNMFKAISRIIEKAMEKKPEKRWKNANIIADLLDSMFIEAKEKMKIKNMQFEMTTVNEKLMSSLYDIQLTLSDNDVGTKYNPSVKMKMEKPKKLSKDTRSKQTSQINNHKNRKITFNLTKNKKSSRFILALIAILFSLLGLIFFFFNLEKNTLKIDKKIIAGKNKKTATKEEKEKIPLKKYIWVKCWNKKEKYFDFTKNIWENLKNNKKLEYAKKYQNWFAKKKGKEVEKDFLAGGISMRMILIPPGKFWMGSPLSEKGRRSDERRHKILISKEYWLGKYEITQKQWYKVTGEKPWSGKIGMKENNNHATTYISWDDIENKFLSLLGKDYNFPTEAQWEYSCRSGTNGRFHWGKNEKDVKYYGNIRDLSAKKSGFLPNTWNFYDVNDGYGVIAPIGSFKENGFGLHDVTGNVWEWCRDYRGHYNMEKLKDPVYTKKSPNRSVRGGGWVNDQIGEIRSAIRNGRKPSQKISDVGFRVFFQLK